jgi:sphinganine-1-phosphate aldolase
VTPDEVRQQLTAVRAHDLPTLGGRTLAYVYDSGLADADALGREALAAFGGTNGLDPTAFPSLLRMEQDLVGMAADLLDGPPDTVGSVTSGGTESLLLAVQTARDARPEVSRPNLVLPSSAHASFHKAAHYFGVRPVLVDVDPVTGQAVAPAMTAAIDADTVLVVASAPSYPHGAIDPVSEIAAAAEAAGVRCHVDACIGGWLLPYLRRDDPDLPAFSFLVPGVTSISVDLHKYGYTPKGAALLLHRSAELRRPQLFATAAWPGYTMLNATTQSTRSGGPLAAAWAITRLIGDDGYLSLARQVRDGLAILVDAVETSQHLRVVGRPATSLLALATDDALDVFTLADELLALGWYTQPQMSFGPFPATLHLSVSAATVPRLPEFLDALDHAVATAVAAGPATADAGLAGVLAQLDPASLDDAGFDDLLAMAGLTDGSGVPALPARMAPVNAVLDVAPPALREALLRGYLDRVSRPVRARDGVATSGS